MSYLVEMRNIVKRFDSVVALDGASIQINKGTINCIVGENGAGKTTLMRILTGLETADEGEIIINNERHHSLSPETVIKSGISMVHQHFMLVPSMTVAQNVVLHAPPRRGLFYDRLKAEALVLELGDKYGIKIDPTRRVRDCSIGEKQQVEILKALFTSNTQCLILDEPTSVLTPQGIEGLLGTVRNMANAGIAIVFITHKLNEVKRIADVVTVMRKGKTIESIQADRVEINEIAFMMTGKAISSLKSKSRTLPGAPILSLEEVTYYDSQRIRRLNSVSLSLREGEILGLAGVQGNGQNEIAEVIVGLSAPTSGRLKWLGKDITGTDIAERRSLGLAFIPEDRINMGVCYNGTIEETAIINFRNRPPVARGIFINRRESASFVRRLLNDFDVRAPGAFAITKNLSGGNIQKLLVAREVSSNPKVLIAFQPTWGLDIGATRYLHQTLINLKERGMAILLISMDLDEVRTLSDRILVIYKGQIVGEQDSDSADERSLGLLMAGLK